MRRALLTSLLSLAAAGCAPDPARDYFYESPLRPYFAADPADPGYLKPRRAGSNARGFVTPKPAGRLRVFVVGGSIAALHQDHPRDLPRLLAAALPGRDVEVINCGQGGYESEREQRLVNELLLYEPDLVVLMTGHNERDDAPLLPLWRLRLGAWAARLRPDGPAPTSDEVEARRARLHATFARRVDAMLGALTSAGVPAVVVLPPLNAEHPLGASWPRDPDFLAGWRAQLAGDGARARAWAPLFAGRREGASLAAVLDARGLAREGKAAQGRARIYPRSTASAFVGRCSAPCRETLAAAARRAGAATADVDAAFRRAALPGAPGYGDFDDAVHWTAARHELAMRAVLAGARAAPRWRELPWDDAALARLPAAPVARGDALASYAVAALGSAGRGAPPPAVVLAFERVLRDDPAALDGGSTPRRRASPPNRGSGAPGARPRSASTKALGRGPRAWRACTRKARRPRSPPSPRPPRRGRCPRWWRWPARRCCWPAAGSERRRLRRGARRRGRLCARRAAAVAWAVAALRDRFDTAAGRRAARRTPLRSSEPCRRPAATAKRCPCSTRSSPPRRKTPECAPTAA